jgi:serine/threonine protein kinase
LPSSPRRSLAVSLIATRRTTQKPKKNPSTLDPVLRREVGGPDWRALAAIAGAAGAYLFAPPGVLPGAYDYYVRTPIYRRYGGNGGAGVGGVLGGGNKNGATSLRALDRDDLVLGRRLGAGGFGDVYRATLAEGVPGFFDEDAEDEEADGGGAPASNGEDRSVVVKRAKEFGEAEAWMNERMARAAPDSVAGFVAAFEEREDEAGGGGAERRRRMKKKQNNNAAATGAGGLFGLLGGARKADDALKKKKEKKKKQQQQQAQQQLTPPAAVWLVWRDEGDRTLADLINAREWPYSAEETFLGRELRLPKGPRRRAVTVRLAMRQLLECIAACHRAGIVHRDIKPQNAIVATRGGSVSVAATSEEDDDAEPATVVGRLKLIDLGAAADLRIGINYAPSEYLMDPRYAPPQQYIMQRQTPSPPPKPVAALLSPVLWAVGRPDRFDVYSAGITLMQMAFPPLKTDNGLFQFRKKLEEAGWDLREWRRRVEESEGARAGGGARNAAKSGARALFGALSSASNGTGTTSASASSSGYSAGFELLDLDGGLGWELACGLLALQPGDRLTAGAALRHPWLARVAAETSLSGASSSTANDGFAAGTAAVRTAATRLLERADEKTGGTTTAVANAARQVGDQLGRAVAEAAGGPALLERALTHGAGREGALTEAQLADEFGYADVASLAALEAEERRRKKAGKKNKGVGVAAAEKKKQNSSPFGALFGAGRRGGAEDSEDEEEEEEQRRPNNNNKLPPLFGANGNNGPPPRNARRTIAWWQERQTDLQRELASRRRNVSKTIRGVFGAADAQQARRERDARAAAAAASAVKKQQQQSKPAVVVAVPARPAMFGGGIGGRKAAAQVVEEQEEEEEVVALEEAPQPQSQRRPASPERPGSPAAIAWLTSLLPPASQPSTVVEEKVVVVVDEVEEEEVEEDSSVVAAASAPAPARARPRR